MESCPLCGDDNLNMEHGWLVCDCGWSECDCELDDYDCDIYEPLDFDDGHIEII